MYHGEIEFQSPAATIGLPLNLFTHAASIELNKNTETKALSKSFIISNLFCSKLRK